MQLCSINQISMLARRCPLAVVLTELSLISGVLFLAGCVTTASNTEQPSRVSAAEPSDVEFRLRTEYERWRGTPHVDGGTTANGLDCSGFVQRVFADAFDLYLPRTTEDQVREGRGIPERELQPGDLVFFRPPKTRHVGIYLSGGEFAHVSSSQGVMVSELDEPYWREAYWTSRRVLPEPSARTVNVTRKLDEAVDLPPAERNRGRVGW